MFKIYMRLLGFARPIRKYAIPYFFYSLFYALFNSLTFLLIMPILKTMFDADYTFVYVEKLPPLAFNQEYLTALFNFTYSHLFNEYNPENVLLLLAIVTIFVSLLSNLFRYMGAWTVENMRTRTLQRMRNEMFSKVVDMNVGYFSDQRKGDIISKITSDVGVVQFCITNTLQVAFREPFLIIGYTVMMVAISWELALFSVLFLPVVALIIGSIVKRLRHPARTSQQRMGELVSTLDESLSGIKVIKSYNATGYVKQKFYDLSEDLARLTLSMARRQQLVVANKMDLPDAQENFERLKAHVEAQGFEIVKASAATGEGLRELMYKAYDLLSKYVPEEDEQELSRFDEIDPDSYEIVEGQDTDYEVRGKNIERLVAMTNFDNDEALYRFQLIWKRLGIDEALKEKGVTEGQTVRIRDMIFEYKENN